MQKPKRFKKNTGKLIVLPSAVLAAEQQMSEWIRQDRWEETIELLEWMLSIPDIDSVKREEWSAIRDAIIGFLPSEAAVEDDGDERALYSRLMRDKSKYDPDSVRRCLQVLWSNPSSEHHMIALEQLVYMEHDSINTELIRWLAEKVRPRRVQFKVLTALKYRGWSSDVVVPGQAYSQMVNPQSVPLYPEDWPQDIRRMGENLVMLMDNSYPSFTPLIRTFWEEWLQRIFLEPLYRRVSGLTKEEEEKWTEIFFEEGVFAWTGTNPASGIVSTGRDTEEIRQIVRRYFQPSGS